MNLLTLSTAKSETGMWHKINLNNRVQALQVSLEENKTNSPEKQINNKTLTSTEVLAQADAGSALKES